MVCANWLKDKRMKQTFVTKPQQTSDKYQTDNLGRDKFQRGLGQIPNTNNSWIRLPQRDGGTKKESKAKRGSLALVNPHLSRWEWESAVFSG